MRCSTISTVIPASRMRFTAWKISSTSFGMMPCDGSSSISSRGRALMTRPRLLMLDEPSQGIMPKLVDEIFQAVKRIRDAGMTVLIVEQRMAECLEIADRAYILQTGRVLMQGSAADISANPDVRKAYLGM